MIIHTPSYASATRKPLTSLAQSSIATQLLESDPAFRKRRHLALFTGHSSRLLLGMLFFLLLGIAHLALGASPLVILMAFGAAIIAVTTVSWKPHSLGSWFTAVVFIQMFGFAWVYKTFTATPLDAGLPVPELSMLWGLFIVIAGLAANAVSQLLPGKPLLDRWYSDADNWELAGIILYLIGQVAVVLEAMLNTDNDVATGAVGPFTTHVACGIFLISAAAARRGKIFNLKILIILIVAVAETLLLNAKSRLVFAGAAVVIPMFTAPLPIGKKITVAATGVGLFAIGTLFIFPAVMVLRSSDFRDKPFDARLEMIESAITSPGDYHELRKVKGDIWYENTDFIPTEGSFLLRFGSLDYLGITLKYGQAGSYEMSPLQFLTECLRRALPGSFLGEKDFRQLADRIWFMLDHRMRYIANCTMGPWGSARLIFGDIPGYLVVTTEWVIAIVICTRLFGMDMRNPLPQFILLTELYLMIDADVSTTFVMLIRAFWQDAVVIGLAGFGVALWKQQKVLVIASHKKGALL